MYSFIHSLKTTATNCRRNITKNLVSLYYFTVLYVTERENNPKLAFQYLWPALQISKSQYDARIEFAFRADARSVIYSFFIFSLILKTQMWKIKTRYIILFPEKNFCLECKQ